MSFPPLAFHCVVALLFSYGISINVLANGPDDTGPTPEQQLRELGIDTSLPSLEAAALNTTLSSNIRSLAIISIGRSKNFNYSDTLIGLLAGPDPNVRYDAIVGLRSMKNPKAEASLIHVLNTESNEIMQQVTITALEAVGGDDSVDAILAAGADTNRSAETRVNAVTALGRMQLAGKLDYPTVKRRLSPLFIDSNANVRSIAAHIAARSGDAEAIPYLADAALDHSVDDWIRSRVIRELETMTQNHFGYFEPGGGRTSKQARLRALERIDVWWAENRDLYDIKGVASSRQHPVQVDGPT